MMNFIEFRGNLLDFMETANPIAERVMLCVVKFFVCLIGFCYFFPHSIHIVHSRYRRYSWYTCRVHSKSLCFFFCFFNLQGFLLMWTDISPRNCALAWCGFRACTCCMCCVTMVTHCWGGCFLNRGVATYSDNSCLEERGTETESEMNRSLLRSVISNMSHKNVSTTQWAVLFCCRLRVWVDGDSDENSKSKKQHNCFNSSES